MFALIFRDVAPGICRTSSRTNKQTNKDVINIQVQLPIRTTLNGGRIRYWKFSLKQLFETSIGPSLFFQIIIYIYDKLGAIKKILLIIGTFLRKKVSYSQSQYGKRLYIISSIYIATRIIPKGNTCWLRLCYVANNSMRFYVELLSVFLLKIKCLAVCRTSALEGLELRATIYS